MADFDVIVAPALAPVTLLGLESHLVVRIVTRETPPVALIYSIPGRYISIGRYHLYAETSTGGGWRAGIGAMRRFTGGRVVGIGAGWLGFALMLPSRIALLKEDASQVKPEQIMNGYGGGMLAGLRSLGLDCFYPGRDAITFEGREIAMCSYEIEASGAMVFEAILAVNRGMETVVHDLELIDPDGDLPCRMYGPESATTLARELKREIAFDDLADAIAAGYRGLLGTTRARELTAIETANATDRGRALCGAGWISNRIGLQSETVKKNRIAAQLGAIEAAVALEADGTIAAVTLSGDFIPHSSWITALENATPREPAAPRSVPYSRPRPFGERARLFLCSRC